MREKQCLLCSTAYGKRRMSWSSTRYMRSTEVLWWWIPQYCAFVAACIHPPVIYSVLGRKKVCPCVHIHPGAHSHFVYILLTLSLLYCPSEMYLFLLDIARVKLCAKDAPFSVQGCAHCRDSSHIISIFSILNPCMHIVLHALLVCHGLKNPLDFCYPSGSAVAITCFPCSHWSKISISLISVWLKGSRI